MSSNNSDTKIKIPKITLPGEKQGKHYFPRLVFLFGLVLIAASVVNYFDYYQLSELIINILLFIGGLCVLLLAFQKGAHHKHTEMFKKYL